MVSWMIKLFANFNITVLSMIRDGDRILTIQSCNMVRTEWGGGVEYNFLFWWGGTKARKHVCAVLNMLHRMEYS